MLMWGYKTNLAPIDVVVKLGAAVPTVLQYIQLAVVCTKLILPLTLSHELIKVKHPVISTLSSNDISFKVKAFMVSTLIPGDLNLYGIVILPWLVIFKQLFNSGVPIV